MTRTDTRLRWARLVAALPFFLASFAWAQADKPFSNEQLDQMLAPIALYPDSLLSQVLMASTYPAQVAEAVQWSKANSKQTGDAAVKAVESKGWDPAVSSLVGFPQALAMMGEKPDWVQNVGDELLPLIAGVGIAGAGVERSADLLPEAQATLAELRYVHASIGAASQ